MLLWGITKATQSCVNSTHEIQQVPSEYKTMMFRKSLTNKEVMQVQFTQQTHLRYVTTVRSEDCISSAACQSTWPMISVDALRRESLFSLFCLSLRSTGALLLSPAQGTPPAAGTHCGPGWGSEQRLARPQDMHKSNTVRITADHSDMIKHFVLIINIAGSIAVLRLSQEVIWWLLFPLISYHRAAAQTRSEVDYLGRYCPEVEWSVMLCYT